MGGTDDIPKYLYWIGPRVSDIQDCDGLFDGAVTLYGYENGKEPTFGEFYDTLEQSINAKTKDGKFENPNFCNSRYNILDGKYIGTTRINHNLDSPIQDLFILIREIEIINRIERKKRVGVVRFMTYNPNHVGRHGEKDYFQLYKELVRDVKNGTVPDVDERKKDYIRYGISGEDADELLKILVLEDPKEEFQKERERFMKTLSYVEERVLSIDEDLKNLEDLPQKLCDHILGHMICLNQNEELMHTLEYKDRFRKLCSELEVGTTEDTRFIMPGSFIEAGRNYNEDDEKARKEYEKARDAIFADLKKVISGNEIVLQDKQSSGGFGTYLIRSSEDLDSIRNDLRNSAQSNGTKEYIVSKYRDPNISLNIHALITEYDVILLPPSIQNIMTLNNKLIYSGADFYAYGKFAKDKPVSDSEFRNYVSWICRSIQARGYRGIIGFDTIVSDVGIEFVEANNRFQASTVLINRSLREERCLTDREGFPVQRFDGSVIRRDSILPSVQALNIMSFTDVYRHMKGDATAAVNYGFCKAVLGKFIHGPDADSDLPAYYAGLSNLKVPYSCFIYYKDEATAELPVSQEHYCHMVGRTAAIKRKTKERSVTAQSDTIGPVLKKIASLSKDYAKSSFAFERKKPKKKKKGGKPESPPAEKPDADGMVADYFKSRPHETIGFGDVIRAVFSRDDEGVFATCVNGFFEKDPDANGDIWTILDLIHSESIGECAGMERDPSYYCRNVPADRQEMELYREKAETFAKACVALKRLVVLRDRLVKEGLKSESGEGLYKRFEPLFRSEIGKGSVKSKLNDAGFRRRFDLGVKLMREIDRILREDDCVMPVPFVCDVFDKDMLFDENKEGTYSERYGKEDYCRHGAYAVKLIFARNILSTLGMNVYRDPNTIPPSIEWYKRIKKTEILPIKIGLINNGIYIDGPVGIRAGVNHSVDLTFSVKEFEYLGEKHNTIDINCECDTPTSAFSAFSISPKENDGEHVTLSYYGERIMDAVYEKPIDELKDRERLPGYGIPLNRIAFVATDRVRFQHSDCCKFASTGRGCKFCEFTAKGESTAGNTQYHFGEDEIKSAIEMTFDKLKTSKDIRIDVKHVLIGGGTMPGDPSEVKDRILSMCRTVRKHRPETNIYLMCTPPAILSDMDEYRDAGVTEVSFNLEVYDHHLASRYMPGKRSISTSGYIAALRYATTVWGTGGNVRSALILGLEDLKSAKEGISVLTSIGVAPILSIFRPTPGTELDWMKPFDSESLYDFYIEADTICEKMRMEFGPACLHCQNNTLALPRELKDGYFVETLKDRFDRQQKSDRGAAS